MYARCNNKERPLVFVLTGDQVSDDKATDALMALSVPNPKAMLADRGYDSDSFRQALLIHGILSVILSRKGRSVPQKTDWRRYRDCNPIELIFEPPQSCRRKAMDQIF
ncbi:transposase [Acetobacter thailandicus]|uniref:transposase n=1 Tax=Acetobacter thailandicus TaxID=1502842 RepID=UPI001BA97FF3|nr:transposase [Acetobacter thailandicus]